MDIGLEIKLLRERKGLSGKDLAQKVGLSQSQVSRLEKGQRRINAETLHKIAEILEVSPAVFFKNQEETGSDWRDVNLTYLWRDMGKIIRAERHKRHMSPEEFATRINKTKGYVQALEEGRYSLDAQLAARVTKALKLEPFFFLETYKSLIEVLTEKVKRLEKAHADATLGTLAGPEGGQGIPVMGGMSGEYPTEFDSAGLPVDTIHEYVYVSGLSSEECFALYVRGDSMVSKGGRSFQDGDIIILTQVDKIRNHDFAFVRTETTRPVFRQVFFERDGRVRLQPLNLSAAPYICQKETIISMWPLVAHVQRV